MRRFLPNSANRDDILIDIIEYSEVTDAQLPEWQTSGEGRLKLD